MADLGMVFRPDDVPVSDRSFDPIPAGEYLCQIVESDCIKKSDVQSLLKLTMEVLSGPYEGRKIFENLNITHPNATAQSIAQSALAELCKATNIEVLSESDDLQFRPFLARVKIEPAKDGWDAKNKISKYKPVQNNPPAGKAAPQPAQNRAAAAVARETQSAAPAAPNSNGPARPWKRQEASAS